MHSSPPVKDGGLGVRRVSQLASQAFIASAASSLSNNTQNHAAFAKLLRPLVCKIARVVANFTNNKYFTAFRNIIFLTPLQQNYF